MCVCYTKQRRAAADVAAGDSAETGNDGGLQPRSQRRALNRVWSRPARKKPLRGPYDSPHSSDDDDNDDDVNTDQLDRGQRLDDVDANMSAEDDDDLHSDDLERFGTPQCMMTEIKVS